jgi:hypothetical protein
MKPIHKITSKDTLRPAMSYLRVKGGYVSATNAHAGIKMPIDEVFPKDMIASDEELYFDAALWATSKMDKAIYVERDNLIFKVLDKKHNVIGIITALDKASFEQNIGRFPDLDVVLPDEAKRPADISGIAFNPALLLDLCTAFGCDKAGFDFTFFGVDKCIKVTHLESKALGIVMPLYRGK